MILVNPEGDKALDSINFHHAYIWKNELSNATCLKIILDDTNEVWWDSSPLICEPAKQDMIESLRKLVLVLDRVFLCCDGLTAFNIDAFSHAKISENKEGYTYDIEIVLNDKTIIKWDRIDGDLPDDDAKRVLSDLCIEMNKRKSICQNIQ